MTSPVFLRANTILLTIALLAPLTMAETVGPAAPENLTATAGVGEVALAWDASSSLSGISGYRVYRDGGLAAETPGDVTTWTDTGLGNGETHAYQVSAVDGLGIEGPLSDEAVATTHDLPGAPTDVAAASGPGPIGETTVSWVPPASDGGSPILGYVVYRDGEAAATVDAATTSWTDAGLTPFSPHVYAVSAFNEVGEGAASADACGMPSPWADDLGCLSLP